jgi:hypothetical protein
MGLLGEGRKITREDHCMLLQRLELNQPIEKDFLVGGFQHFIELLIINRKTHIANNHQSEYEGLDARPVEALKRYKLVLSR